VHRYGDVTLVTRDPVMLALLRDLPLMAAHRLPVLVTGETGTGKELIAAALHELSDRGNRPFLAVNCAALPDGMQENELFGHVRGAFTGADRDSPGVFGAVDGGTLLLDEVGEMDLKTQTKLLRALESGEVRRLGEVKTRHVDVRVVAATSVHLHAAVEEGTFRMDLLQRLSGFHLKLPPLRERPADVDALARHFAAAEAHRLGREVTITDDALEALRRHRWPGNVRELRNEMERAVALSLDSGVIPRSLLRTDAFEIADEEEESSGPDSLKGIIERHERRALQEALHVTGGNKSAAARALGIGRGTLRKKLRKLGLDD
jgi:transcriptional regulator with PAS, ATPase and Fis domain